MAVDRPFVPLPTAPPTPPSGEDGVAEAPPEGAPGPSPGHRGAAAVRQMAQGLAPTLEPAQVWRAFTTRLRLDLGFDLALLGRPVQAMQGAGTLAFEFSDPGLAPATAPPPTPAVPVASTGLLARTLAAGVATAAGDLRLSGEPADRALAALGLVTAVAVPLAPGGTTAELLLLGCSSGAPAVGLDLRGVDEAAALLGPALAHARAYRDLADRTARLEETGRERQTRSNFLVHDLRNLLTSAQTNLEFVRETCTMADPDGRDALREAEESLGTLDALVTTLLDLSQLEETRQRCLRLPTPLRALIDAATKPLRSRSRGQGVQLEVEHADGTFALDAVLTARSLRNLVAHALRRSPPGGRIHVRVVLTADLLRIEVTDAGPALPEDERESLFHRFAAQARSGGFDAHGLGLHFVRLAAEAQGGRAFATEGETGLGRLVFEVPANAA